MSSEIEFSYLGESSFSFARHIHDGPLTQLLNLVLNADQAVELYNVVLSAIRSSAINPDDLPKYIALGDDGSSGCEVIVLSEWKRRGPEP